MNYCASALTPRQKRLLELVDSPIQYVEAAQQLLEEHLDAILDLNPCPRFVMVSSNKIFLGELENEVGYRFITEGVGPGLILDLDPGFIDMRL